MKKLDPKNLLIEEFTTVDPVTTSLDSTLFKVKEIMTQNNVRHVPVTKDDLVVGIVSERNLYSMNDEKLKETLVKDVMVSDPYTVRSSDLLKDVVFEMSSKKIGSALVNDSDNKLYGIFTSIDALNTLIELL